MKLAIGRTDVTPLEPVFQGGYVQRKSVYERVHDPILTTVFVLETASGKTVWITTDVAGVTFEMIDLLLENLKEKGLELQRDHLVWGATHTHSGPAVKAREPYMFMYSEKERENVARMCQLTAECVYETYMKPGQEVHTHCSDVLIDGLYSNRNDKNKLSDKHEYMIGFFDDEESLVGVYHLMSHHCTVLGSQNMELSADLFGALRSRLEEHFGCPFFMAQGNAGDMGNKQYRDGNDFAALDRLADNLLAQITNKYSWQDIDMDGFEHRDVVHNADYHVDYSDYGVKYEEYTRRLETATNVDEIKLLTGWQSTARIRMNIPPHDEHRVMPAEIVSMKDLQIVLVPGELGSILGLRIKAASKARLCLVWGYVNGSHLGYMIEKEAFTTESQESQVTEYPAGVCDEYAAEIIRNL